MSAPLRIVGLVATALAVFSVVLPRSARADARPQAVPVLAIDSDDADEQADALTNALRSRIRQTPGWTVVDTTQSLSMLTAALQCPPKPDAACLARIGEKLKTEELFWGVMSKAPGHQVRVELHLWNRGKADKVTHQSYSDNLKDANDDNLKRVATDVFDKLVGIATGAVAIHGSTDTGTVLVDGVSAGTLASGRLTLNLAAGSHTIEIQSATVASVKRTIVVDTAAGAVTQVDFTGDGAPAAAAAPASAPSGLPVRKIVGWSLVAGGAILIGVGIGFGVADLNDQSDLNKQRQDNYQTGLAMPVADPCKVPPANMTVPATTACNDVSASHTALALEVTGFAVGGVAAGVGVYLLLTGPSDAAPPPATTGLRSLRVLPSVGPGGGSMVVLGRF